MLFLTEFTLAGVLGTQSVCHPKREERRRMMAVLQIAVFWKPLQRCWLSTGTVARADGNAGEAGGFSDRKWNVLNESGFVTTNCETCFLISNTSVIRSTRGVRIMAPSHDKAHLMGLYIVGFKG